ncbi:MAG TPA: ChaN family lipoprotein, partial [Alphaproteobacteria bacterium]|nr:ChaN family lipoprotein [Alphaproteobacteria bacterium]
AEIPPLPGPIAALGHTHPLLGRIVRPQDGQPLTSAQLAHLAASHGFVLLGEKHDNPDHHRLQAWVIEALVALGRRPAIAMEMLDADQVAALAAYRAKPGADAAGLGAALDWSARGWPDWAMYAPIAEIALRANLSIIPANLTRPATRTIGRGGLDALEPPLRDTMAASPRFDAAQSASLADELRTSHCGKLPDSAVPRMSDVQWARDAQMAAALRDAVQAGAAASAVLIAGAGHVRTDRAVPWHLRQIAPLQKTLSVAFVEVSEGWNEPKEYGLSGRFDIIWFTARVDDQDPCTKFEGGLRRLRHP